MSDTPRTDANECEAITGIGKCVGVNFARQIERELAELQQVAFEICDCDPPQPEDLRAAFVANLETMQLLEAERYEAQQQRDEKHAALIELIKASKCAMNAIAMSDTCIIRFEAALKEAGIDDGFGVRAQKAAGIK